MKDSNDYRFSSSHTREMGQGGISPRVTAERLLRFMDESGIDIGVLLPIAPYVPNEYIYRVVTYEPKRLMDLPLLFLTQQMLP